MVLATARQLPALHPTQFDNPTKVMPPADHVPVGQGFAVAELVAEGQKKPDGHCNCVTLTVFDDGQ